MTRLLAMVAALSMLTACDFSGRRSLAEERSDDLYSAAMKDYHAGRVRNALNGFRNVVERNPANSSARFQYACLLQDLVHDYRGAYCAFDEYLLQNPDSDKAEIARERLAICEKELAQLLAKKHGLLDSDNLVDELKTARDELLKTRDELSGAKSKVAELSDRIVALNEERARLVKVIKGETIADEESVGKPSNVELKALLEDDDNAGSDRIRMSEDIANLKAEEQGERSAGPDIIAPRQSDDVARRDAAKAERDAAKAAAEEKRRGPAHPPTYVVQEGDTLFRIAARFYGRISAWRKIRDANKAVISTDGRVRTGDTIVLP